MNEKVEQSAAIKFCWNFKKNNFGNEKIIDDGFGEGVVSHTTIYTWYKWFKDSTQSLKYGKRTGWLSTAVTNENETRVCVLLMKDFTMKNWLFIWKNVQLFWIFRNNEINFHGS